MAYRKYLIALINILIAGWLVKETFFPEVGSDVFGLFLLLALVGWLFYNIYAFILYKTFVGGRKRETLIELGFIVLLLLPFVLLWYFTS